MNKYLYILSLAGAALFSACSTSDDLSIVDSPIVDKEKEAALIFEAGQNSEVPITLGIGQRRGYTRAPLVSGEGDIFSTEADKYIGVFCLATDYQSSNHPIENKWSADDETGLNVRMKNVPAEVVYGAVTFRDPDNTANEKSYYYPMSNWMKYNFYAYYPWQATTGSNLEFNSTNQQVWEKYFSIDGSQDIIWGKANPSTDDAFSAKYFIENPLAVIPQLQFEHKLVQFKFQVKVLDESVYDDIDDVSVTDMYINNGIYQLALVVADKNTPANDGNLYWFSKKRNLKKMNIKESGTDNDLFINDYKLTFDADDVAHRLDPQDAGYIMLAPPDLPGRNYIGKTPEEVEEEYRQYFNSVDYQLVVKMNYTKNDSSLGNTTLNILLNPPAGGFVEGKTYNIVINIKGTDLD